MKVRLLPLAVAIAMAGPGAALAAGPTLYGKFNVSYEYSDFEESGRFSGLGTNESRNDDADTWELNSNSSRIGVRGAETISNDLGVFYQAEFGVHVDDGESNGDTFTQRDIFVGVNGDWGEVQAGKFDTPLKKSQGKVDQFSDSVGGDITNVILGEVRANDLIQYSSPKLADVLQINVAIQPGEEYCDDGGDCEDGAAENFSISAVYNANQLYAALAYDDGIAGYDVWRLTGMINLGQIDVGAIVQMAEESDGDGEQQGYILSAALKLDEKNRIRFQYGASESDDYRVSGDAVWFDLGYDDEFTGPGWGAEVDGEVTMLGIGYDHLLSKQTRLYTNFIMLEREFKANGVTIPPVQLAFQHRDTLENNRIQFGIEHSF